MDRSTAILDRLLTLHPKEIDLSLDRIERLLASMGRPDLRIPPVIHIAGTNGKGSTTAFLRAMLEAAGLRVHVYTSPHLVRFHERIRLGAPGGGRLVDEDALVDALTEVERINADAPITQFEITTAAAFRLFADHPADVTLLEVGLGGRLDATNVVAEPLATVVTPLSIDHEKFLGETLAAIAYEKAGIFKRGRPAIIAPQPPEALAVIEREAARRRAPLLIANQDWTAFAEHGRLVFQDLDGLLDLPPPRLIGRHQFTNAGTAIAALRAGRLPVSADAIATGLATVEWPARMQRLATGDLAERVGPGVELWLDGGHNPGAGIVIAEAMADLEERAPRPLVLVAGMLTTKDPVGFLRPFAGLARRVITVPVEGHQGYAPAELARLAEVAGLAAEPAESLEAALARVAGLRFAAHPPRPDGPRFEAPPRVLICGSLYLAGTVLHANGTPPR